MPMQIRRTTTANPPTNLEEGQLAVEMATATRPNLWVGVPAAIDASGRRLINPLATPPQISAIGATAPATPALGDLWFDTGNNVLMVYDGATWQAAFTAAAPTPTPPPLPQVGDLWFDTTTMQLMYWTGTAWAPIGGENRRLLLQQQIVTTPVASVDFFYDFSHTTYDQYNFEIYNLTNSTNAANLAGRVSIDGTTWLQTGGLYFNTTTNSLSNASGGPTGSQNVNLMNFGWYNSNLGVQYIAEYLIRFSMPWTTNRFKYFWHDSVSDIPGMGGLARAIGSAKIETLSPLRGVSFFMSGGNINTGVFNLYAISKTGPGAA